METSARPLTLAEAMVEAMAKTELIPDSLLQLLPPVTEGEQILGTLPESLQRLWAFRLKLDLALKATAELLKLKRDRKKDLKDLEELEPLMREKNRQEILVNLFWQSISDIFGYEHQTVGIRQNWQIVAVPESKHQECDCPDCQRERHGDIAIPLITVLGILGHH